LGIKKPSLEYFHETLGERNRIGRWFRKLKERTNRFYNNKSNSITTQHNHTDQKPRRSDTNLTASSDFSAMFLCGFSQADSRWTLFDTETASRP